MFLRETLAESQKKPAHRSDRSYGGGAYGPQTGFRCIHRRELRPDRIHLNFTAVRIDDSQSRGCPLRAAEIDRLLQFRELCVHMRLEIGES